MMPGQRALRISGVAIVVVLLWPPVGAFAQRGQDAALVGTVRDGSGAAIAGATLSASSPQLIGRADKAVSDAHGGYRFPFLPPGNYDVVAALAGFKSVSRSGVTLLPGLTFTLDFSLEVAPVSETVFVSGPTSIVDVHTSSAPVLIDRKLLENLPLSRSVSDMVNLAPGVIRDVAFGGSVRSNPLSLDGTNGNEPSWGTPTVTPNLNWVEEIQVVSVGADARYGEYTGVLQNAITRSGSNRFSGLFDSWTTRPGWTGNNRGSLSPLLQERFRPLEIIQRWDSNFQVGGPLLKDRLWFFSGFEAYRNAYRPASFSGVAKTPNEPKYDETEHKFITKATSALSPAIRVEGYYAYDTWDATGVNAGPLVRPEALAIATRPETMWNARALWTLNSSAFLELRHGGHHANRYTGPPADRRSGPPGHSDQLTGVTSQNALSHSQFLSRPITTGAHVTYFAKGKSGRNHEIRGGFEHERARLLQASGYTGGRIFFDRDGQPDTVYIGDDTLYRPTYNRWTTYAQDGWEVADRLTLNIGLRAGFYRGSVPTRGQVFSAHSFSPRIGGAWDVAGDHRTVVRAHYGRYHDALVTTFFDFLDPLSQGTTIVAQVVGPNQFQEVTRFGSLLNASIDPDLKFSFAEEYLAGIEHQLPWGITARSQFIWRDFKNTVGFIDTGSHWQPVQRIDPGPDGRVDTPDDVGPITVFFDVDPSKSVLVQTNPTAAYRRHRAVQFVASKRYANDVGFQASYTWSRTVGSYNNAFSSNAGSNDLGTNGVFVNPNRALNAEGRTPQDFPHEVKVLGTYRFSRWGGLNVSGLYVYQSGRITARAAAFGPQTQLVSILVEPRGTRKLPDLNKLDLRVEKTWKPSPKAGTLGVFADIFNVTNQGIAQGITQLSGPNFFLPNSWLEPRVLRAGVRLMF